MKPEELAPRLQTLAKALSEPRDALQKIAFVVEGRAKNTSPIGASGNLARSNRGLVLTADKAALQNSASYARYVDEGTKYMSARHFGQDAIDQSVEQAKQILRDYASQQMGRVGHG